MIVWPHSPSLSCQQELSLLFLCHWRQSRQLHLQCMWNNAWSPTYLWLKTQATTEMPPHGTKILVVWSLDVCIPHVRWALYMCIYMYVHTCKYKDIINQPFLHHLALQQTQRMLYRCADDLQYKGLHSLPPDQPRTFQPLTYMWNCTVCTSKLLLKDLLTTAFRITTCPTLHVYTTLQSHVLLYTTEHHARS